MEGDAGIQPSAREEERMGKRPIANPNTDAGCVFSGGFHPRDAWAWRWCSRGSRVLFENGCFFIDFLY